ncbi:MAG: hypothetical protein RLZZ546_1916 [Bacteroidota bacterium]|jgi:hypothetical protein
MKELYHDGPFFFQYFHLFWDSKWACLIIPIFLASFVPVLFFRLTENSIISILLCFTTPTFIMHSVNGMSESLYLYEYRGNAGNYANSLFLVGRFFIPIIPLAVVLVDSELIVKYLEKFKSIPIYFLSFVLSFFIHFFSSVKEETIRCGEGYASFIGFEQRRG